MSTPDPQPLQRIEHSSIQGSNIQQGQAGKNLTQVQAETLTQVYVSLFGGDRHTNAEKLHLDLATRFLKDPIQPELEQRLRDTLHQNCWLNSELEEQPHQVGGLASNRIVDVPGRPSESLDLQTTILEVFARPAIRGRLLILGEPGVGKTTTLLALANQLVQQALANPGTAIPVIFELSSWKDDDQKIQDWLVKQLQKMHPQLTPKVTRRWLEEELLLPLLDGLDELGERQSICIQQLNEFADHYPGLPFVVCCRADEYDSAEVKLAHRRGAVRLQPLTRYQVQSYLQQVRKPELWNLIETQPEMQALLHPDRDGKPGILQIPLFLKLAAETYDGKPFNSKTKLLEAYIDRRLSCDVRAWERGNFKNHNWAYQKIAKEPDWRKTRHYLSWLSQKLEQHDQIEFLIEIIQFSWVSNSKQISAYLSISAVVILMISGLASMMVYLGLISSSTIHLEKPLDARFWVGLITLTLWLITLRLVPKLITPSSRNLFSWTTLRELPEKSFPWVLPCGLLFAIGGAIVGGLNGQLVKGLLIGTTGFILVILGFFGWIIISTNESDLDDLFESHLNKGSKILPSYSTLYSKVSKNSNQLIFNSGANALITAIVVFAFISLVYIIYSELTGKPSPNLFFGLGMGIFAGLVLGGSDCIKHFVLRLILSRIGCIPWNYAQFLNYCVERRLLQHIGGRYRFLHRELLKHFAHRLEISDESEIS